MKLAALILDELAIVGLLAVLLVVVLLYQPAWIWIAAPLVMLGGFAGNIAWAKRMILSRLLIRMGERFSGAN